MEFFVLTPSGMAHILSTDPESHAMTVHVPRNYADIAAARQSRIKAGAQLVENGRCHFCDHALQVKGHWCSALCAQDFEEEKRTLLDDQQAV